ncbi:MAG: hypothetical protein PHW34_13915 [Hespellia sp.]|nr:hypothetical protein [Hespellia sp.]
MDFKLEIDSIPGNIINQYKFIARMAVYYNCKNTLQKHKLKFWEKESMCEQKLFAKLKKWESRHPIIGIFICTILGGILISLVAGIILEAVVMGY